MTKRRKPNDTLTLLNEAEALERVGGTWTQRHAAAVTGYSVAFLRISDCPKDYEEGNGPQGKLRVVYVPEKVRAWKQARRITERAG